MYLQKVEVVNFDVIDKKCRSDPLSNSETLYKTIKRKDLKFFSKKDKKALSPAAHCPCDDLYIQHFLIIKRLKTLSH